MSAGSHLPLVIHGWSVFAHPLFLAQLEALAQQVEALKQKDPAGYVKKNATKRLAAITKLAFDVVPQDPTRPDYRQGGTLGDGHRHWFRAKFFQQYRLFFRYHAPSKVIVFAWVNDDDSKRAYESNDDAYRVFRKMLESGHPPDDFDQLLAEAARGRLPNGAIRHGRDAVRSGFRAVPCREDPGPGHPFIWKGHTSCPTPIDPLRFA